ncbi:MAG: DedA family protein [Gemmatimonadetes bacterium]|nr:DedA family protein [Gemmatimonadota bacterium]
MESIINWLIETVFRLGYPGIVVLMAIESSVFPLPSEIVIPPAGVLVAQGRMNGVLVVLAGTAGSVIGAIANYALAVWLGRPLLHRYSRYFLVREASLDRAEAFFRRHGEISTFVGRLIPVIRHLISLPAGISRMPLLKFGLYTGMGAAIWCAVLTWIGWYLGRRAEVLRNEDFQRYSSRAVMVILPVLVVVVAIYVYFQRRKANRGADESTRPA